MRITTRELSELSELYERFLVKPCCCRCGERRARHLAFEFSWRESKTKGQSMTFTMPPLNASGAPSTVTVIGSPVIADGVTPSRATLSNPVYTSSDPPVFTV